jgi:hypothetical protein
MREPLARLDRINLPKDGAFVPLSKLLLRFPVKLPPQSAATGRKTRLSDDIANVILLRVAEGNYEEVAAAEAGVTKARLSKWLGMKGEPYKTFRKLMLQARARGETHAVTHVRNAFPEKPDLALKYLERKAPERWAAAAATSPANVNVSFNLTQTLQRIEARERTMRDPRGPRVIEHAREPIPITAGDDA